jgi:stage V sporulation protein D (sporulation-specific penicillin-binding protein)
VAKELRTADGRLVETYQSKVETSVIAAKTAKELNAALESVVENGTGRRAFIEGYELAGKTGTAQKIVDGAIAEGQYVSSFIGFGPTRDPQLCALVIIDEPTGDHYGGQVAGPIFRTIMYDAYRYLGIPVVTAGS